MLVEKLQPKESLGAYDSSAPVLCSLGTCLGPEGTGQGPVNNLGWGGLVVPCDVVWRGTVWVVSCGGLLSDVGGRQQFSAV